MFVMSCESACRTPMGALTPNVEYSEGGDTDNRGGEDVNKATEYLFQVRKRGAPPFKHINVLQSVWQI